jgi:hypothetical protein
VPSYVRPTVSGFGWRNGPLAQRAVESRNNNLTGISHPLAPSRVIVTHVYFGLYEQTGQSLRKRVCERSDGYIVAMVKF